MLIAISSAVVGVDAVDAYVGDQIVQTAHLELCPLPVFRRRNMMSAVLASLLSCFFSLLCVVQRSETELLTSLCYGTTISDIQVRKLLHVHESVTAFVLEMVYC